MVASLKNTLNVEYIAPGHRTGEPTFAALKQALGNRYIYESAPRSRWDQAATAANEEGRSPHTLGMIERS